LMDIIGNKLQASGTPVLYAISNSGSYGYRVRARFCVKAIKGLLLGVVNQYVS